jgi:hydroxypyruvate isomerase
MLNLSANLNFLFKEVDFMNRFEAAAKSGFKNVEFMFPYDFSPEQIKKELDDNQLNMVLFNLPAGDWDKGDRGIALDPSRKTLFQEGVQSAIKYTAHLGVKQVNCLVGKKLSGVEENIARQTLIENLRMASEELGRAGIKLLLEFINNYDIPGFYLNSTQKTLDLIKEIDRPNLYLQYDIYHAQRSEGELIATINKNIEKIAHIQLADNPGRNEPGTGEINYPAVFKAIEQTGYTGYIGLEYNPKTTTTSSFGWIKEYGLSL